MDPILWLLSGRGDRSTHSPPPVLVTDTGHVSIVTHLGDARAILTLTAAGSPCMTCPIHEVEAHQHGLRSPIAAIAGLAAAALQRRDLDDELLTHLQAIRDLADDALQALEHNGPA
jgi:hypothetical protein